MALTLLRTAIQQNQSHSISDDLQYIIIHNKKLLKTTITSYKTQKLDSYYDINAIYYLYTHATQKYSEYIASCATLHIQPIDLSQQRYLLQFLKGERDETIYYDKLYEEKLLLELNNQLLSAPTTTKLHTDELDINSILEDEIELATRHTILQTHVKSLNNFVTLYQNTLKQKLALNNNNAVKKPRIEPTKQATLTIPIIVVPAAVSSVLTMYNVEQFLQNGVFQPSSEYKKENPMKPTSVTINKTSYIDKNKTVQYHVIDDITQLKTDSDWNRVVAVFVHGATWQFNGWPKQWPTPASIFNNVCAFHLYFDDEPLHTNIKQWNTNRLQISKTKRYQDRSVALEFWDKLGQFLIPINAKKQLKI